MEKIESITNPPIERCNHSTVVHNRSLLVFGGWDGTKTLNDMYELSLSTYMWYHVQYRSDLTPSPVYRHTAVIINNDSLVIFGGVNETNEKFNELYKMDINSKKWSVITPSGEYPAPRTYHNMCYIRNNIIVLGGYSNVPLNDSYSIYINPSQDEQIEGANIDKVDKSLVNLLTMDQESTSLLQRQLEELKQKYEAEVAKNVCKVS